MAFISRSNTSGYDSYLPISPERMDRRKAKTVTDTFNSHPFPSPPSFLPSSPLKDDNAAYPDSPKLMETTDGSRGSSASFDANPHWPIARRDTFFGRLGTKAKTEEEEAEGITGVVTKMATGVVSRGPTSSLFIRLKFDETVYPAGIDVEMYAFLFDSNGVYLDCIFYRNAEDANGGVSINSETHSCAVDLNMIAAECSVIAFAVAVNTVGLSIFELEKGEVEIRAGFLGETLRSIQLEDKNKGEEDEDKEQNSIIFALIGEHKGVWHYRESRIIGKASLDSILHPAREAAVEFAFCLKKPPARRPVDIVKLQDIVGDANQQPKKSTSSLTKGRGSVSDDNSVHDRVMEFMANNSSDEENLKDEEYQIPHSDVEGEEQYWQRLGGVRAADVDLSHVAGGEDTEYEETIEDSFAATVRRANSLKHKLMEVKYDLYDEFGERAEEKGQDREANEGWRYHIEDRLEKLEEQQLEMQKGITKIEANINRVLKVFGNLAGT